MLELNVIWLLLQLKMEVAGSRSSKNMTPHCGGLL
jgi:hypothetical protein